MNKYLILRFENAGLFSLKDKLKPRKFEEPITKYQVSNVLHVLFGERPVPTFRKVYWEKNDYLFQKSLNSYLKMDECFFEENFQTNKEAWNSTNPIEYLNWSRVEKYLGSELYEKFIQLVKEELNIANPRDLIYLDIKKSIDDNKKIEDFLRSNKKTAMWGKTSMNAHPNVALKNNRGFTKITRHSGTILVPVTDEDILNLKQGCCTILDDGLVYIKNVKMSSTLSIDGFVLVKDINAEI